MDGNVRERADEVEVSDDWPRLWTRRQVRLFRVARIIMAAKEEEEDGEEEED